MVSFVLSFVLSFVPSFVISLVRSTIVGEGGGSHNYEPQDGGQETEKSVYHLDLDRLHAIK